MMCNFNSGCNIFIYFLVCFFFNVWIINGKLDILFYFIKKIYLCIGGMNKILLVEIIVCKIKI